MAPIIVASRGINLPYSSLFNVSPRDRSTRLVNSRPSEYFWKKATSDSSALGASGNAARGRDTQWFDSRVPALSDSEDESSMKPQGMPSRSNKNSRFTKLRRIAFKAFTITSQDTKRKNNIVTSTEIIFSSEKADDFCQRRSTTSKSFKRETILKSFKFKSGGSRQPRTKKLAAVLNNSISASSPSPEKPKTWDEYCLLYAGGKIDVRRPPVPPFERDDGTVAPSVFQARFFAAPIPTNESIRQLVMNRMEIFGGKPYDNTEQGLSEWKERLEISSKLMKEGKAPSNLASPWQHLGSHSLEKDRGMQNDQEKGIDVARQASDTLEQHPVLRNIVEQCRESFGAAISLLCVIDDQHQIILAESGLSETGLGGIRDFPREIAFCGHTILGDRKGLTVLDTGKDWRFENNPSVQSFGPKFYAGVPLMSPNLDGSWEAEQNTLPLGALCVIGFEPRESFSVEDRQRLVYMSEYARREIGSWFVRKMEHKREKLAASEETWNHEMKMTSDYMSKGNFLAPEVFSNNVTELRSPNSPPSQPISRRLQGINSKLVFTSATSPSLGSHVPLKAPAHTSAGLFENLDAVLSPGVRRIMDLATKLVGETLDLSLVYLTAVLPPRRSEPGRTLMISGHNIPIPVPVFDASLHLRALREPEGGLLYQNPSHSDKAALQPKSLGTRPNNSRPNPYASAMIFAVGNEVFHDAGGFVLAGYTDDPKRVFGAEDAAFMKKFAQELSTHTSKLLLSSSMIL